MKRTMVICVLMALVVAGSASANYLWSFNATTTNNINAGTATLFGVFSPTGTGDQSFAVSTAAYAAEVNLAAPGSPGTSAKNSLWKKDYYAAEKNKLYVEVWAGVDFPGTTFDFRLWVASANTVGGFSPKPIDVKVLYDPNAGIAPGTKIMSLVTTATKTQATATLYNLPVYKTSTPLAPGAGYILELSVPEPGSIVAMLSGLVGLVGFGIRRRK